MLFMKHYCISVGPGDKKLCKNANSFTLMKHKYKFMV